MPKKVSNARAAPKSPAIDFASKVNKLDLKNAGDVAGLLQQLVNNGLSDALLGQGFNPNIYGSSQLSQTDTLFKNNRWYLISNFRQLLSEIYVEHGLIQTVVDVPVDDGLRGGVKVKSKQLNEAQVNELMIAIDREAILPNVIGQALKWNRLYGGAGVLMITDQDPLEPFDIKLVKKDTPIAFRAVDMWELFYNIQNIEGYNPALQTTDFDYYDYYGERIHASYVMKMKGLVPPSYIRPQLRGWGFSVVESVVRSINQYLKNTDLTFEVLDEFKLDIYKIKNLTTSLLSNEGQQNVRRRTQLANLEKNYHNSITMDADDDYVQKQLSFSGLAEVMKEIRMQVASDLRMPLTKIFGISAAGFNSGEDDIENYNAMVESQVRQKAKYDILRILEVKCQQLFEFVPTDLEVEFEAMRMLSAEQEENCKTQQFNRVIQARQAGEIDSKEFRQAVNKDSLLPIQLDITKAELVDDDDDAVEDDEVNPKVKGAVDDRDKKSALKPKSAKEAKA